MLASFTDPLSFFFFFKKGEKNPQLILFSTEDSKHEIRSDPVR